MTTDQLSIFMENKPCQFSRITQALAEGQVDIRAMSIADTQDFGIVRMIVSDCRKAQEILHEKGFFSSITQVMLAEVPDHPGGLGVIADVLAKAQINIDYMYACITIVGKCAYIVLHVNDQEKAADALEAAGVKTVSAQDLS